MAEHYMALASLSKELIFDRRKLEWKLTLSLWASIAAVTYFLMETYGGCRPAAGIGNAAYWAIVTLFGLASILLCLLYLPINAGSHAKDMLMVAYFRKRAMEALRDPAKNTATWPDLECCPWTLGWKRWWCFLPQVVVSGGLVAGAAILLRQIR